MQFISYVHIKVFLVLNSIDIISAFEGNILTANRMLASSIPTIVGKGKVQGETIKVVCAYPDIFTVYVSAITYLVALSYLGYSL